MKTDSDKKSLLRRVRKQRLKYITILPSLITILNGIFGFAAIVVTSKGHFALAGYLILMAMIADMLDGRLARISQNTSSFGGQLDSLCDIISFGVAPAFMMLNVLESSLTVWISYYNESFIQRFIWVTAAAYVSCAAIRLARFNVENEEDTSAHMSFVGLPTPAAAGVVVSMIIFQQKHMEILSMLSVTIVFSLPFFALGAAILMVSRIRYPHVLNQYLKGKKPFSDLIKTLLLLAFVWWNLQAALMLIFCGFALTGFGKWLYYKIPSLRSNTKLVIQPQQNQ
ncbi:MAG: CDP-diacylglycerol--serine O-phosphatidyltransferase [Sedimentisphaerales bacterium]|nr:CDP-diacylglycerol--serine O-phosphatidyltransferase [Sedimentisphaerales bacterium]